MFFLGGVSRSAAVRLSPIDCGPRRANLNVCCSCETNKIFPLFSSLPAALCLYVIFIFCALPSVYIGGGSDIPVLYCTLVLSLPLHHDITFEFQFSSVRDCNFFLIVGLVFEELWNEAPHGSTDPRNRRRAALTDRTWNEIG